MSDQAGDGGRNDRVKLFTLAEANNLVPWVRAQLEAIRDAHAQLNATQEALGALTPQMRGNGHRADAMMMEQELERLIGRLAEGIHAIEERGIQIKDLENGIIDFPALHRGRVVLLCWRYGEGDIGFWHELTSGFAGRRPISEFEGPR